MITKKYTKRTSLPEYSFGNWLKENAGTIGGATGAALGTVLLPGVGTSIGASLGSGIGGGIENANATKEAETLNLRKQKENELLLKNQQLISSVGGQSNISTFDDGGGLGESTNIDNRSIKGSLVYGLQDRYNSTKNKNEKENYLRMLQHLNKLKYTPEKGRDEWDIYSTDPILKDYINDPTTKGLMHNRGFNELDLEEPEMSQKLVNGGYIIDYKGNKHKDGGIPVDAVTGKAVPRQFADAEVEGQEMGVKFPGEETPYIFSEKLGFSDPARKIVNKYSKRKNDSISKKAMFKELENLMSEQEEERENKLNYHTNKIAEYGGNLNYDDIIDDNNEYKKGGFMNMKYSVGKEYKVSDNELKRLQELGYKIKVL